MRRGLKEEIFYFKQAFLLRSLIRRKPAIVRTSLQVNYGSTSRAWKGLDRSDDFAVRWSGFLTIKLSGHYKFLLISDDGSKLFLEKFVVVSNDGLHGMRSRSGVKYLNLKRWPLRLEFFERTGRAGMVLKYKGQDTNHRLQIVPTRVLHQITGIGPPRTGGLKEETFYFFQGNSLRSLKGTTPANVRIANTVNYASTTRAWPGMSRKDHFAVRWSGAVLLSKGGSYTFSLVSDDGSKLYLDGHSAINNDGLHGMRNKEERRSLNVGAHDLRLLYFECNGKAGMIFRYKGRDTQNRMIVVPQRALQIKEGAGAHVKRGLREEVFYFAQSARLQSFESRTPNLVRTAATVNYASAKRVWPGLARSNNFAVRWLGRLNVKAGGRYLFSLISDDGSRLFMGSSILVNNDGLHGMRNIEGARVLSHDQYTIKLEYFERYGSAGIIFRYKGADTSQKTRVVPTSVLRHMAGRGDRRTGGLKEEVFYFQQGRSIQNFNSRKADTVRSVLRVEYKATKHIWPGLRRRDHFAVRWSGFIVTSKSGTYRFRLISDDGSKLFLDHALVVNNDGLHGMQARDGHLSMSSGIHLLSLGFFERAGNAGIIMKYRGPDTRNEMVVVPGRVLLITVDSKQGLNEEIFYFRQGFLLKRLNGRSPNVVRTAMCVNYAATSIAWPGLSRSDHYAIRWSGFVNIKKKGVYTFSLTSDDGSKLYVDNTRLVNNDGVHASRKREGRKPFARRLHPLRLEYFEFIGRAAMLFKYAGPDTGSLMVTVPPAVLQQMPGTGVRRTGGLKEKMFYFTQGARLQNLDGRRPNEVNIARTVNYASTRGAWPGKSRSDMFAVRWSGVLMTKATGAYRFYLNSDDGSKLFLDNGLIVNNDGLHGMKERSGQWGLNMGEHLLKLDYFERLGAAGMIFEYTGADTGNRKIVVPRSVLHPRSTAPARVKPGLKEEVFYFTQGRQVPRRFRNRKPDMVRTAININYASTTKAWLGLASSDNFAVRWSGLLAIAKTGYYKFYLVSDDGSMLFIDKRMVVNNDGLHGMKSKGMQTVLKRGNHEVKLHFFERTGKAGMIFKVVWINTKTSGRKAVVVPARMLQHVSGKGPPSQEGLTEEVFYFTQGQILPRLRAKTPDVIRVAKSVNYVATTRCWFGFKRAENFAVRWSGFLTIRKGGKYTFSLASDDGSKLFLDWALLVNNDGLHAMREIQVRRSLSAATHPVKLVFFERSGKAGMIFKYEGPDTVRKMIVVPQSALQRKAGKGAHLKKGLKEEAFYFAQGGFLPNLKFRRPNMVRTARFVNYASSSRSWPGFSSADHFAVRWTGSLEIENSCKYRFALISDDGSKLHIYKSMVVNNDGLHSMRSKEGSRYLFAKLHALKLEFFEKTGRAGVVFKYRGCDTMNSWVVVPSHALQYTSAKGAPRTGGLKAEIYYFRQGSRLPSLTSKLPDKVQNARTLNYPSTGSPWLGFSQSDHFAVRWTGSLTILRRGFYLFETTSDDGSRLRVGSSQVVDNDGLHAMKSRRGQKSLVAGSHALKLEFFEKTGNAGMLFKYQGWDSGNRLIIVPQRYLAMPSKRLLSMLS